MGVVVYVGGGVVGVGGGGRGSGGGVLYERLTGDSCGDLLRLFPSFYLRNRQQPPRMGLTNIHI